MDWDKVKSDGYKQVDGSMHDLSHLQDAKYHFTIEASGKYPEISFSVLVQYSSHCITWGPKLARRLILQFMGKTGALLTIKVCIGVFVKLATNCPKIFPVFLRR